VIFVLFPLVIWTGLAMSPAFVSAVPSTVTMLGGRQSARTLHFLVSVSLVAFPAGPRRDGLVSPDSELASRR
jgi:thiosulfate reductase cytochrome b subunit